METRSTLAGAVDEGEVLLAYAAQSGLLKKEDEAATKSIIEIRHHLEQHTLTDDMEAGFWAAFNSIAARVQPVTTQSLRATDGAFDGSIFSLLMRKRQAGLAERAVRRYRRWAVGSLACLVLTQTYYFIGSTVLSDITTTIPKEAQLVHDALLKEERAQPVAGVSAIDGNNAVLLREDVIGDLQAKEATYDMRLDTSYSVLEQWNSVWRAALAPRATLRWPIGCEPDDAGGPNTTDGPSTNPHTPTGSLVRDILSKKVIAETTARFALSSIQTYLLPFLYGFLGTCVYILRNLATHVKARAFSSEVDYRLRMPLGALAGVAIAWFVTPETSPAIVRSLSPLALAFLAGYSVEVLFSAMDRFIAALSSAGSAAS